MPAGFAYSQSFERLGVALAIGLLIGLERGWERRELPEGRRAAGLRTFGIIGLLGGVTVELSRPWVLAAVAAAVALFAALGYWRETENNEDVSLTSAVTAMLTLCLGALAGSGELTAASSSAVVVALLLGFKPELHGILRRIERTEMLATLRLLLISVVLLPVLPRRGLGPWNAFNPYQIWWLVVLVAGVSYIGYFAVKLLGERRGMLVTGLFGGLVSSTAVTLNLGRQAGDDTRELDLLTAGIAIATAMMFPRILVLVGVIAPMLAGRLAWPFGAACIGAIVAAVWFARRSIGAGSPAKHEHPEPRNPLDLRTALEFGLILAVVMVLSRAATAWLGDRGLYVLAAFSALVDVDAISLSVATMAVQGQTSFGVAIKATLIAAAMNTALKPILVTMVGGTRIGWRVLITVLTAAIVGSTGYVAGI
jgi:uncharacterized membrane protein (DUF4010 family)